VESRWAAWWKVSLLRLTLERPFAVDAWHEHFTPMVPAHLSVVKKAKQRGVGGGKKAQ